ncbi:MAG: formaldehyde-activating enzyme [Singulisphaera sp.]
MSRCSAPRRRGQGRGRRVAEGTIAADEAEDLVIVCGVFIHWDATDNAKIQQYNYEATKLAIQRALKNEPNIAEVVARKDTAHHPFAPGEATAKG